MNLRRPVSVLMFASAAVLLTQPVAHAETGSSQINVGCILQSLSGESPTADCDPVQIPVP
ncbi:hypothetical protein [Nocardia caishijiensis]|uniref:Uncharacterized protein n=1 Tax=Nocardia caishijiensis TaxID=184756 RepID=A0ABQ6YFY6_9NOCA|nr:hypothetical protein [Nocardia caishijiensis]KAF0842531.1 hypothetical protein FNL39_111112 [Nocardia caishijiensis]